MRIRFVTPYFPPEVGAPQTRIYELAVRLTKLGHAVSVLTTFPSYPTGVRPKEWHRKLYWHGTQDGLSIYRFWSYATPNRGFLKRIISHLSFAVCSAVGGLFLPDCDGLVVESPPLFDGFVGVSHSWFRRTPYLFMVSDLWPESAVQMGVLRNWILVWAARQIELLFYRRSTAVLALTAGIRRTILADGIPPSKVLLFRNSVDCDLFRPGIDFGNIRHELQIGDHDYVVLYAGTLGLAHNLKTLLNAAALFQQKRDGVVRFVLGGEGAESDRLRAYAQSLQLTNVTFTGSVSKDRMPELLNAADCIVVPLRRLEVFRGALPTKMFEAMACGKPLILGIEGEAEELVREAGAGYCVTPDDPNALYGALLSVMQNNEEARQRGHNGRNYVLQHFSRDARAHELSELLHRFLAPASTRQSVTA